MDDLESCPVLVILGGTRTVRCGAKVGIWAETKHPRKTIFAGCTGGHTVEDMRRDINRETEGAVASGGKSNP